MRLANKCFLIRVLELREAFKVVNVYGSCGDNRVPLWEGLLAQDSMRISNIILGGDLNFIVRRV